MPVVRQIADSLDNDKTPAMAGDNMNGVKEKCC